MPPTKPMPDPEKFAPPTKGVPELAPEAPPRPAPDLTEGPAGGGHRGRPFVQVPRAPGEKGNA